MKSDRQKEDNNDLVLSYLTLRNLIGICGMLLPLALVLTTARNGPDKLIEPTISDYFYTSSGELFVVVLSTLAVFLFTYNGYNRADKIWTNLAATGALGVAFFPTSFLSQRVAFSVHTPQKLVPTLWGMEWHFLFAALFFLSIAVVCIVFFTKTKSKSLLEKADGETTQKGKRNRVYIVCGWTIIACVIGIGIYFRSVAVRHALGSIPAVFILEFVAVEAFGFAWLTKGETLWPDGESYMLRLLRSL